MPQYRCYFLDHRHYVVASRMITCESDEAASAIANDLLQENDYPAVEVWADHRQVYEKKKLAPI
jgi:hypothetical protein